MTSIDPVLAYRRSSFPGRRSSISSQVCGRTWALYNAVALKLTIHRIQHTPKSGPLPPRGGPQLNDDCQYNYCRPYLRCALGDQVVDGAKLSRVCTDLISFGEGHTFYLNLPLDHIQRELKISVYDHHSLRPSKELGFSFVDLKRARYKREPLLLPLIDCNGGGALAGSSLHGSVELLDHKIHNKNLFIDLNDDNRFKV